MSKEYLQQKVASALAGARGVRGSASEDVGSEDAETRALLDTSEEDHDHHMKQAIKDMSKLEIHLHQKRGPDLSARERTRISNARTIVRRVIEELQRFSLVEAQHEANNDEHPASPYSSLPPQHPASPYSSPLQHPASPYLSPLQHPASPLPHLQQYPHLPQYLHPPQYPHTLYTHAKRQPSQYEGAYIHSQYMHPEQDLEAPMTGLWVKLVC